MREELREEALNLCCPPSLCFLKYNSSYIERIREHSGFASPDSHGRYVFFACRYSVNLANRLCIQFLLMCSFGLQSLLLLFPLRSRELQKEMVELIYLLEQNEKKKRGPNKNDTHPCVCVCVFF